jgi:hypothetical protein
VLCQGQIRFALANLIRICHAALKAKDFLLPGNTVCAFLMVDSGMGYKTTGWSAGRGHCPPHPDPVSSCETSLVPIFWETLATDGYPWEHWHFGSLGSLSIPWSSWTPDSLIALEVTQGLGVSKHVTTDHFRKACQQDRRWIQVQGWDGCRCGLGRCRVWLRHDLVVQIISSVKIR